MLTSFPQVGENLEAQVPHMDASFPYYICCRRLSRDPEGYVPWHWHREMQFVLVKQGAVRLRTTNCTHILRQGEGAFINANVLHYKEAAQGQKAVLINQIFAPSLISGAYKSVYEQKYVTPVLECRSLEMLVFKPSVGRHRELLNMLKLAEEEAEREECGYELGIRNALSHAWRLMYQDVKERAVIKKIVTDRKEERIKKMLLFIQENYQNKITLKQITDSANISEREGLRCFKQNLNTTPFTYLLEYRIRKASGQLLETRKTITEIVAACGFASPSYFGKHFKERMGCTPSEYRKRHTS